MRRTKIVATLGPSSTNREVLRQLVEQGLDVARINLSHGTVDHHRVVIRLVRAIEQEAGRPIGVLLDTAGPEVRIRTRNPAGLKLVHGAELILGTSDDADLRPNLPALLSYLNVEDRLVLGDGNLALAVKEVGDVARVVVESAGFLDDNKKITCPGQVWPLPVLTDLDRAALAMGIEEGIDWVAASFIRTADDVVQVRRYLEELGSAVPIIAKIETKAAVENLEAVVRMSDGIMVARGDLGVEYPPEDVPWLQRAIISAANRAGKPVITATQMLESMVHDNRPTRAEVTDVAHAVLEGTDAVMLSEETAAGDFPVEALAVMARTAAASEAHLTDPPKPRFISGTVTDGVCHAALTAAEDLEARVIVTATETGHTAFSMAAHRPHVPILAVTPYEEVARRLTLVWGIQSQLINEHRSLEAMVSDAVAIAVRYGWADAGDRVIVTGGAPVGQAGSTNGRRPVSSSFGRFLDHSPATVNGLR
ncbi:pyruvate kinase [Sulfobacillus harzensis]|uniref:pyruvate kinase n=1 Tax=Sulfobacillus harzensis TaxID=2729629 RepID=UPI001FACAD44|nr:pyruvate kinase [Sulfobacillus harzensis]